MKSCSTYVKAGKSFILSLGFLTFVITGCATSYTITTSEETQFAQEMVDYWCYRNTCGSLQKKAFYVSDFDYGIY